MFAFKVTVALFFKTSWLHRQNKRWMTSSDVILEIIVFTDVTKRSSLAVKLLAHWVKHKFLSSFTATQCADV